MRAMKLRLPDKPTKLLLKSERAPTNTVIISEKREGCFLQTLNCGCIVIITVLVVFLIIVFCVLRTMKEDYSAFKNENQKAENSAPLNAWKVGHDKDDLTDENFYYIYCDGLHIEDGIIDYTPRLAFRLSEKPRAADSLQSAECILVIEPEAIPRGGCAAAVRIDSKPIEQVALTPGQKRSSLFLPAGFAKRLDGARTLIVRFETSLGKVRTLRFNLGGVSHHALVQKMRREISTR